MRKQIFNLYPLNYSKIDGLNKLTQRTGGAFEYYSHRFTNDSRISASYIYDKKKNKCYVLIAGETQKQQVDQLKKMGVNLGKPKRIRTPYNLSKRLGYT